MTTDKDSNDQVERTSDTAGNANTAITFDQVGTDGRIAGIAIVNALLNMITFGIYRFWGRTNVRKAIWSSTVMNDIPFEYTGRGMELFKSFLIVTFGIFLPILIAFFGLAYLASVFEPFVFVMFPLIIAFYVFLLWVPGFAIYAARRYRLSRTNWRGIRLGVSGSAVSFGWINLGYALLSGITFGWFYPVMAMRLNMRQWQETSFGDRKFVTYGDSEGATKGLWGPFAIAWGITAVGYVAFLGMMIPLALAAENGDIDSDAIVLLPILAIYVALFIAIFAFIWFHLRVLRKSVELVGYENVRFRLENATYWSYFWLLFGNLLILAFTLGIGLPWTQLRRAQYLFRRLKADGDINFDDIKQSQQEKPKSGEGFADAFDLGAV